MGLVFSTASRAGSESARINQQRGRCYMAAGDLLNKWLIGAGIGAVFGLFIALGQILAARGKKKDKEKESETPLNQKPED